MSDLKLYIAVRDDFPDFMAPTLVAHATLRHHLTWADKEYEPYLQWLAASFKKCVVRVNLKEFTKIQNLDSTHGMPITESWENTTLNGDISCITVIAGGDVEIPNVLKFAKLWKPNENQTTA